MKTMAIILATFAGLYCSAQSIPGTEQMRFNKVDNRFNSGSISITDYNVTLSDGGAGISEVICLFCVEEENDIYFFQFKSGLTAVFKPNDRRFEYDGRIYHINSSISSRW